MIRTLHIEKLFGRFDYEFNTKAGGVTIITGPNGYGKTTIFQIIEAIGDHNIEFFLKLEFKCIAFGFDNGEFMTVRKTDQDFFIENVSLLLAALKQVSLSGANEGYCHAAFDGLLLKSQGAHRTSTWEHSKNRLEIGYFAENHEYGFASENLIS
jgi:energy-coupling factor transporter ATP-binding protein EcfA2